MVVEEKAKSPVRVSPALLSGVNPRLACLVARPVSTYCFVAAPRFELGSPWRRSAPVMEPPEVSIADPLGKVTLATLVPSQYLILLMVEFTQRVPVAAAPIPASVVSRVVS